MTMNFTSRNFLQISASAVGGLMIGFPMSARGEDAAAAGATGNEINAWLTIDPNNVVSIVTPQTEMGQGAFTSVPMMVAEELDIPWANVRGVLADANRHVNRGEEYVDMSTGGSNLVRNRHPHILRAGASARERLNRVR